jgi:hypothetical protein
MKINTKFEKITLLAITIMYFLLINNYFSSLIYILIVVVTSIYFFPIKVIMNRENPNLGLLIGSSFLISSSVVLSYISFVMKELPETLKGFLLVLTVFNLFLIYKYVQINEESKFLHLIVMLLLIATFFK